MSVLLTKYYPADQIRKNGMGGACGTLGGEGRVHMGFWWGNLKESEHLEELGVRWEDNILMDLK